ncbi:MAG: hypothetical protein EOP56_12265 [Sphingobacteriales bacterium]|nr:MAG: hypothetical protein EOP56_12265 [Sphingobacteriales bacterium]
MKPVNRHSMHEPLQWRALKKALEPSPEEKLEAKQAAKKQNDLALIAIGLSIMIAVVQCWQAIEISKQKQEIRGFDTLLNSNIKTNTELEAILTKLDANNTRTSIILATLREQLKINSVGARMQYSRKPSILVPAQHKVDSKGKECLTCLTDNLASTTRNTPPYFPIIFFLCLMPHSAIV